MLKKMKSEKVNGKVGGVGKVGFMLKGLFGV